MFRKRIKSRMRGYKSITRTGAMIMVIIVIIVIMIVIMIMKFVVKVF